MRRRDWESSSGARQLEQAESRQESGWQARRRDYGLLVNVGKQQLSATFFLWNGLAMVGR